MRFDTISLFFQSLFAWFKDIHLPKNIPQLVSKNIKELLEKDNARYAGKTALSILLSYVIALFISERYAFWAPISAIIVMQISVAASVESSLDRILGSFYGAVLGLLAFYVTPPNFFATSMGLFCVSIICASLLLINFRYRLAGIVAISVFLNEQGDIQGLEFAFVFLLLIVVGIVASMLISVFLWPISGAEKLHQSLKKQYLMAADYLETITNYFLNKHAHLPPNVIDPLHEAVSANRAEHRLVKEYEAVNISSKYRELDLLITGLEQIRVYISSLLDALDSEAETIDVLPMTEELMALSSSAASGLRWIASHTDDQQLPEVRWYIEATSIKLADLLKEHELLELSADQLAQIFSFYNAMNHLAETVANLEEQIEIVTSQNRNKTRRSRIKTFLRRWHFKRLFRQ